MTNAPGPPGPGNSPWGGGPAHQGGQQDQWGQPAQPGQWGQQPTQPGHQQMPASPYQQQGYAANPYDSEATPILVTGILSLVLCGLIGLYAWIKGNDLKRRATSSGWPEPSTAKVGRILGIIGSIIGFFQIGFAILWVVLVIGAASSTGLS
ncbi:MAG: hypothetical protein ACK5O2_10895 [Microthrixaceae bacterium]